MIDFATVIFFSLLLGSILHWGAHFAGFFTPPLGFFTSSREKVLAPLYFLLFFLCYFLFPSISYQIFLHIGITLPAVYLFTLSSFASLFVLSLISLLFYFSLYPLERKSWFHPKDFLISLLCYALAFPIVTVISQLLILFIYVCFGTMGEDQIAVRYVRLALENPPSIYFLIISLCVFAPIIEEILFRGLLHRVLRSFFSFWTAAAISSASFAFVHFSFSQGYGNIPLLGSLITLSFYLSYLYERQKRILPCILLHSIFNLISAIHIINI